jgi:hypothetical protein
MKTVRECLHDERAQRRIMNAYAAARAARFEHGETPNG